MPLPPASPLAILLAAAGDRAAGSERLGALFPGADQGIWAPAAGAVTYVSAVRATLPTGAVFHIFADRVLIERLWSQLPGARERGPVTQETNAAFRNMHRTHSALLAAAIACVAESAALPLLALAPLNADSPSNVHNAPISADAGTLWNQAHALGTIAVARAATTRATLELARFFLPLTAIAPLSDGDLLLVGPMPPLDDGWPATLAIHGDAQTRRYRGRVHGNVFEAIADDDAPVVARDDHLELAVVAAEFGLEGDELLAQKAVDLGAPITGRVRVQMLSGGHVATGTLVTLGSDLAVRISTNRATVK